MATELGHRERVLRAVARQDIDRVPFCFVAEEDVEARLAAELGLRDRLDIIRFLDADTIQVGVPANLPDLSAVEALDDLEALDWPSRRTVDLEALGRQLGATRATGLAVLSGAWATIFTGPRRSMGEARFLTAMLDEPDLIARIVEKAAECYLDINDAVFSACSDCIDIFYFGSDFGTQRSLFIGRDLFRRFFAPHLARLAGQAKEFGLPVMFHTCGAVAEIIPDLIACGIDVLDPVQVSAAGMQPAALAQRFKGRIAFHGGLSTQTLLPYATPAQVRAETLATIEALGPSGYIAGPDQWMMSDIPTENMVAMYQAIRGYVVS